MTGRGTTLLQIGPFNQTVILDAIRRAGSLSRVELAERTGLAPQTVTNISRRLLAQGLIVEAGTTNAGRGKPRTLLRLNGEARVAVGVHLDPAVVTLAVLDLTGNVLVHERLATPSAVDPAKAIQAIAAAVDSVIASSGVARERVLGVGIAAPGPVDLDRGVIDNPPNLPGWHQVPLREDLARASGLPVLLDKDVTAAAVAETWWGNTRAETMAVLYLGTGIGAGLVVDGEVIRGSFGNAGEIGHIVVDPDGPPCLCGQRGCVAVTLEPAALVAAGVAAGVLLARPAEEFESSLGELFERATAGDPGARRLVDHAVKGISRLALVVTNLLDLDRLVLGGPYWSLIEPYFLGAARAALDSGAAAHLIHAVDVVGTSIGEHFGAVGAASLVLDQAFSPHPATMVSESTTAVDTPRARRLSAGRMHVERTAAPTS